MGARRFSGLGIPPSAGSEFDANTLRASGSSREKEFTPTPGSTAGGGAGQGDDGVPFSAEYTSGHFFAGFGEGLTTKSPVVYFMKTKHTGEDDCKTPINPHLASVCCFLSLTKYSFVISTSKVVEFVAVSLLLGIKVSPLRTFLELEWGLFRGN